MRKSKVSTLQKLGRYNFTNQTMFYYTIKNDKGDDKPDNTPNPFDEILANIAKSREKHPNRGILERILADVEEVEFEEVNDKTAK